MSSKESYQLHKIHKILKYSIKKYENEKLKLKETEESIIEWKEVARRLEYILLIVVFIIITVSPVYLFGKYFMQINEKKIQPSSRCGCEYSFIKGV